MYTPHFGLETWGIYISICYINTPNIELIFFFFTCALTGSE